MSKPTIQIRIRGAIAQSITEWHSKTGMSLSEVGQLYLAFAQDSMGTPDNPSKLLMALETRVGWADLSRPVALAVIAAVAKKEKLKASSKKKK